jgi:hypothetical protein
MKNETTKKIEIMKIELEMKLERIKNENAAVIHTATSFSWLALVTIVFLFVVVISSDFFKVILFLKENFFMKRKKQNNYKENENNKGSEWENFFRKVAEKDKILFKHPYFRKNKKNNELK